MPLKYVGVAVEGVVLAVEGVEDVVLDPSKELLVDIVPIGILLGPVRGWRTRPKC